MWVLGCKPAPQPRPCGLYARMRSPSPTWSWAPLLLSKSCRTDCSNARAATRLKNAFTFSPGGPRDSPDPIASALTRRRIWEPAGVGARAAHLWGCLGQQRARDGAGWPGFPPPGAPQHPALEAPSNLRALVCQHLLFQLITTEHLLWAWRRDEWRSEGCLLSCHF